jgi:hypothetical protein
MAGMDRSREHLADLVLDASEGNGKFGFNAGVSRTAYTKGIDGADNASNINFQPRFDFKPTDKTSIGVRFFVSDGRVRLNSNPDTAGTLPPTNATIIDAAEGVNFSADADDPDAVQESKVFNGVVSFTHLFSSKAWLGGYYSGLQTNRRNENGILGDGFQSESTSHNDGLIHTANVNANFAPQFHAIKAGYEFEYERYSNGAGRDLASRWSPADRRRRSGTVVRSESAGV